MSPQKYVFIITFPRGKYDNWSKIPYEVTRLIEIMSKLV